MKTLAPPSGSPLQRVLSPRYSYAAQDEAKRFEVSNVDGTYARTPSGLTVSGELRGGGAASLVYDASRKTISLDLEGYSNALGPEALQSLEGMFRSRGTPEAIAFADVIASVRTTAPPVVPPPARGWVARSSGARPPARNADGFAAGSTRALSGTGAPRVFGAGFETTPGERAFMRSMSADDRQRYAAQKFWQGRSEAAVGRALQVGGPARELARALVREELEAQTAGGSDRAHALLAQLEGVLDGPGGRPLPPPVLGPGATLSEYEQTLLRFMSPDDARRYREQKVWQGRVEGAVARASTQGGLAQNLACTLAETVVRSPAYLGSERARHLLAKVEALLEPS